MLNNRVDVFVIHAVWRGHTPATPALAVGVQSVS